MATRFAGDVDFLSCAASDMEKNAKRVTATAVVCGVIRMTTRRGKLNSSCWPGVIARESGDSFFGRNRRWPVAGGDSPIDPRPGIFSADINEAGFAYS